MNQSTLNAIVKNTKELDAEALRLVKLEENCSANLVVHLVKILKKRVHLELGFSSLLEYCTIRLQMSQIQSRFRCYLANLCTRFPQAIGFLAKGKLSITVLGKLATHLNSKNCTKLLKDCVGMSRLQVQEYVSKLRSQTAAKAPANDEAPLFSARPVSAPESTRKNESFLGPIEDVATEFKPAASQAVMRFLANSPELLTKLERLAEVDNKRSLKESLLDLLDKAVSDSLDRRDPKKKLERREARQKAKASKKVVTPSASKTEDKAKVPCNKRTRYIPSKVRETVFSQANYQCEFVGASGQRCSQRTGLQLDHIQPFSRNGSNQTNNLRCLCGPHNLHEAKKQLGEEFIESKIMQQPTPKNEARIQFMKAYALRRHYGNGVCN